MSLMYIGDIPPPDLQDGAEEKHSKSAWDALLDEMKAATKGKGAAPMKVDAELEAELEPTAGELAAGKQMGLSAEQIRAAKLNHTFDESVQRLRERGLWTEE